MTTYKGIKGLSIQTIAGDPSNLASGDIWYNSSSRKIRGTRLVAAWSSAPALNAGRQGKAGGGTQTAAWVAGGSDDPQNYQATELYDGSSWTEVGNPNETHPQTAGGGVQTAGWMATGGGVSGEHFDGSTWTHAEDCNQGNAQRASCGPQTAAMMFGSEPVTNATESYDGTNWTEVADYPQAFKGGEAVGTNTAAVVFGGYATVNSGATYFWANEAYTWDGSSFTAIPNLNTASSELGKSGASSTAAMKIGGIVPPNNQIANVEIWNGTSWTEVADIPAATNQGDGAGTSTATIFTFGKIANGTYPTTTVEWNEGQTASSFTSS